MKFALKLLPVIYLTCLVGFRSYAQKRPSIQTESVVAPSNIKIDGKATEWDNKFQSFNNHTLFYYTLSNSEENLYLIVQVIDRTVIRAIMNGGLTLTINKTGNKNDKDGASVSYPVFDKGNKFSSSFKNIPSPAGTSSKTEISNNAIALTTVQLDSAMNVANTNFNSKAKNIRVTGIKNMDTLISVYNQDGIKAIGAFDNRMVYTYELAIPLKQLGIVAGSPDKFAYQIKINEVAEQGISNPNANSADPLARMRGITVGPNAVVGQSATDFWGEYTLAKKQ